MRKKVPLKYLFIAALIVVTTGAVYVVLQNGKDMSAHQPSVPTTDQDISAETATSLDMTQTARTEQDKVGELVIGKHNAPITIVEYGDYKCPKCNDYHQKTGSEIEREWVDTGKAKVIFRPYPVYGADSGLALYASYCAAEQGKFASYYNKMFDYMWQNYFRSGNYSVAVQPLFTPEKLGQIAAEAGLDNATFTTCAAGQTHKHAYEKAVDAAAGDSVQGTPTIVIGDQKIVGPQPYSVYKTVLNTQ